MGIDLWHCTAEEYHADASLSQSKIKAFLRNPEGYYEQYVAQTSLPTATPKHFVFGTDFERLLFYGETPGVLIPIEVLSHSERNGKDVYSRRGTAWKEFEDRMKATHGEDVRLLTPAEWQQDILPLLIARDKLREHDAAKKLVYGQGFPHAAFRWEDDTGLPCKCQLDMLHGYDPEGGSEPKIIVDVKTAADSSPAAFSKAIGNFGYHLQACWYREAVRQWCGKTLPFVFVVSQSKPPYTCEVYELTPDWYTIAETQIRTAIDAILKCQETNHWHRETHGQIVPLNPMPWDYPR